MLSQCVRILPALEEITLAELAGAIADRLRNPICYTSPFSRRILPRMNPAGASQ